ncbi:MAG: hypothetical protein J5726_02140 [Treponema sp.]|nr:hypothetical protein [Treponema sp.]
MLQFYFLSVFFNLIAGFVLVNDKKELIDLAILKEKTFRIVLGIICAVTGIIKLFVVVNSSAVIVGDLLPAVAGMLAGLLLVVQDNPEKLPEWFNRIFITNKMIVGFACLGVALLHFVFPGALFL